MNTQEKEHILEIQTLKAHTLFDQFVNGVFITDKHGIIRYLNESYAKFLGVKRTTAIGRPLKEFVPKTRVPHILKRGMPEVNWKYKYKNREGVATGIPLKIDGNVIGLVGQVNFDDIAEFKDLATKMGILKEKIKHFERKMDHYLNDSYYTFDDIVGMDDQIIAAKRLALAASNHISTILVEGESGTGKEMFAHAIHRSSLRSHGPFIRLNCAAIPSELIEAELFGYTKGAFTDANLKGKPGKFELADKGIIFLDEIGEMPLPMQSKLLRVFDDKEITRLGSINAKKFDFAIIAATNRNLMAMVEENQFRLDLFHRLSTIYITLPPLREMKKTLSILCDRILEKKAREMDKKDLSLSQEVRNLFYRYNWPGNVRELSNTIESAINMSDGKIITLDDLPRKFFSILTSEPNANIPQNRKLDSMLNEFQIKIIQETLRSSNYNISQTAKQLGIHRTWLHKKIKRYDISFK